MFKHLFLAGIAGLSLATPVLAADPPPPAQLADFIGYSYASHLAAPHRGDRIAWVEMRKGVRNVWSAAAPDFAPRKLTDGTRDDGQDLTFVTWSPDGRILAWVRGEVEHNGWATGAPANPASAPGQQQEELWASVNGAPGVKIAEGSEPLFSSKGQLVFIRDYQVYTVDPANPGKATRLFYDRGRVGGLAWSPDGSRLAFVSRRGDHSFIGIYNGADTPITWVAPATAYDDNPAWSPDGTRIAFSRRTGTFDILAASAGEKPNPFSIWVASAADGSARQAWKSPATLNGSFPSVPDGLFLMWGAGDRITFRAELDGWAHLYALPAAGGEPVLLTPGEFMVEHVTMTPDGTALLYSANAGSVAGDIDRRHVFRVAVDRPGPAALTPGSGLEWTPAPLAGGRIAYISATAQTPPRVALAGADGKGARLIDPEPAPFPSQQLVVPKPVTFTAADGTVVHGQLFRPNGGKAKKPALVFVHGGPPRQMLLGWSYMDYYTHSYAMNQYLASRGYVVLSVNYRLGIGYGRAFQHAAKAGASGNSEYQDVVAGARYLQALADVDPARLGIWGGSYGGLLTAQGLARNSDIFKAGVDLHGVHDWTLYQNLGGGTRYEQGDVAAMKKIAFESSPEAAMATWRSPVLLIHGDDDRNVPFNQTVDLARRLAAQNIPFEEMILPNEVHGFLRYDSWLRADARMVRFLDERLKP
ncbi:S9 family peptidase [Sphingomonas quercus]|uniref:Prolyl oligopeptidase family serine peptidase n=1 Tax=Sphingomonas quercus TaxID=2842451 RepID=A0ABS6BQG5_9SPHN|nr:prolyl oligopeptidase family serine peptidase [Sphingomonas quercus]MBU3079509.1 prolyl oligopeptidase family serine peptidase [Sphingomonas quercus]